MPQTTNFGFPLWGDTPPEGATGKDLRDAILGEGEGSLASMVDAELKKIEDAAKTQCDWNVFDENDPKFVKNRPCYYQSEKGSITLSQSKTYELLNASNANISSGDELAGSRFSVSLGSSRTAAVYEDENDIPKNGFGLIRYKDSKLWVINDMMKVPCAGFILNYRNKNSVSIQLLRIFMVNKVNSGDVSINYMYSQTVSSPILNFTNSDTGICVVVKIDDSPALTELNASTYTVNYDICKLKKLPPEVIPDEALPTKLSELENDAGYLKEGDVKVPTKVSELTNDAGYLKRGDVTVPTKVSELTNDEGYLKSGDVTVPTKLSELTNDTNFVTANQVNLNGKENTSNKVSFFNKIENLDNTKYPSTQAVYDFVKEELEVTPTKVFIPFAEWDGDTEERDNFLGLFYKVSDATYVPDHPLMLEFSLREADGTTSEFFKFVTDGLITELKDAFGIVVLTVEGDPAVVIANRSGTLPVDVIEEMTGENPGIDVPYTQGTYFLYQGDDGISFFISKAETVMTVKEYIDDRDEIKDTLVSWNGNTDGLSDVLGMLFKVSDNIYVPNKIVYRYADKHSDGTVTLDTDYITTDGVITDLAEDYGIYYPAFNGQRDGIVIAKRSGVLPAAVVSAILGSEVPVDVPYEAGTYVSNILLSDGETRRYLTEAFYCVSAKDYIDSKFEELRAMITDGGE